MKPYSRAYYEFAGGELWALAQAIREQETGGELAPEYAVGDEGKARGPYQMRAQFLMDAYRLTDVLPLWIARNPFIQAGALRLFFQAHFDLNPRDVVGIYHNGADGWVKLVNNGDPYVDQVMSRMNEILAKEAA